jgi:hypothetical protein
LKKASQSATGREPGAILMPMIRSAMSTKLVPLQSQTHVDAATGRTSRTTTTAAAITRVIALSAVVDVERNVNARTTSTGSTSPPLTDR